MDNEKQAKQKMKAFGVLVLTIKAQKINYMQETSINNNL